MIRTQVNVEQAFWDYLDEIATEWKRTGKTDRHAGAGTVASHIMQELRKHPEWLSKLIETKDKEPSDEEVYIPPNREPRSIRRAGQKPK